MENGTTWPGGFFRVGKRDRKTYIIKRQVAGKMYEVSTRTHDLRAAMEHLKRFEADPEAYSPRGTVGPEPVYLTAKLVTEYLAWCATSKGNSEEWMEKQLAYLTWWVEQIGNIDLRKVSIGEHLKPALAKAPNPRQRVNVIKAIFGWLRSEKYLLKHHEDATLDLKTVPAKPAQWTKSRVIAPEVHAAVLSHLTSPWREALIVLSGTGWHVSELRRFVEGGSVLELKATTSRAYGAHKVLETPLHKNGDAHRTVVTEEVADAGTKLKTYGSIGARSLNAAIRRAAKAAQVKHPGPGSYRHTAATWAVEAGADPAAVSAFLGHRAVSTTKRFYAALAVVPKVPTPT